MIVGFLLLFLTGASSAFEHFTDRIVLKEEAPTFSQTIHKNKVMGADGHLYDLSVAKPYPQLFANTHFQYQDEDDEVVCLATGQKIKVRVMKGTYDDGSKILVAKDVDSTIIYVQINPSSNLPVLYFLQQDDGKLLTFSGDDIDYSKMGILRDEVLQVPPANEPWVGITKKNTRPILSSLSGRRPNRRRRHIEPPNESTGSQRDLQTFVYERGDGDSEECQIFKVINVAIAYDTEFCQLHRSSSEAADIAIQIIVATGSVFYENDLCVRIALTGIFGDTCTGDNGIYAPFTKNSCGGDPGYLREFSAFMAQTRLSLGIDQSSLVHMFSGSQAPGFGTDNVVSRFKQVTRSIFSC